MLKNSHCSQLMCFTESEIQRHYDLDYTEYTLYVDKIQLRPWRCMCTLVNVFFLLLQKSRYTEADNLGWCSI